MKLSKNVENDDLIIERSTTCDDSEEPSFWAESFSRDVRNVGDDSQLCVFHVSCQDDDTPVNSDNESNDCEYDDKKRRKSILNQMSLPQVLKDQGMTSLQVSFLFQYFKFYQPAPYF